MTTQKHGLSQHFTHKANLKHTRYGWLRLTPSHSVHLISEMLEKIGEKGGPILDPFCGAGTTALACAERGISCDTTDINPFLIWLTGTKTHFYTDPELTALESASASIQAVLSDVNRIADWTPPLHQIEKWWDEPTLQALGRALSHIRELAETAPVATIDLLKIIFCRVLIERANVSFGHQSMSFKKANDTLTLFSDEAALMDNWRVACREIQLAACSRVVAPPRALLLDARSLTDELPLDHYACVITSPPYPNRMSYIRELRPYMYWLGYLNDGRQAGELDWQAIGGTWGCATSNAGKWEPSDIRSIPYDGFTELLARIAERSPLLSRYIHKYFFDMVEHVHELFKVVRRGGTVHYIVGNSKFYDVLLPVEEIFTALFASSGFDCVTFRVIRKRTSKKELFEYIVSARKPL